MKVCSVEGCERKMSGRGWCAMHYARWYRNGDPLAAVAIVGDDTARFWSKVDRRSPDECWLWTGTIIKDSGYAVLTVAGKVRSAHRFAYELVIGPIPSGLTLDHTCHSRNLDSCAGGPTCAHRRCVNPSHLEPVTAAENNQRAVRDHCKHGHPFDEANTYWAPKTGKRVCRACWPATTKRYRERKRAA